MEEIKELETLGTASGEYNSFPDKTARGALEKIPAGFKKEITGQVGQILEVTEVDDEGRITGVKAVDKPDGAGSGDSLPDVTAADAGKFLRVSATGVWAAEPLTNVAEVGA